MPAYVPGDTATRVSTMGGASTPETKMATVFVKCMSIPWKASGRFCGVGCVRIGASPKRNSRCTWVFSSLFTTSASEAKRCWVRSLSYSSHKTLESNKSAVGNHSVIGYKATWSDGKIEAVHPDKIEGIYESLYHAVTSDEVKPLTEAMQRIEAQQALLRNTRG